MRHLVPHVLKSNDSLAQQMAQMDPVDGTIDVSTTKNDLCWKCAARNGLSLVSGLVICCGRCESRRERQDHVEDVELPVWNNV
jgi:hypothetical protein